MTSDSTRDLIATAKSMREQLGDDYPKTGSILDLWLRTADALESVIREREVWRTETYDAKAYAEQVERERDELAAVIEKAKLAPSHRVPGYVETVYDVLHHSTSADALRARDARVWEEGARWGAVEFGHGYTDDAEVELHHGDNPYENGASDE